MKHFLIIWNINHIENFKNNPNLQNANVNLALKLTWIIRYNFLTLKSLQKISNSLLQFMGNLYSVEFLLILRVLYPIRSNTL